VEVFWALALVKGTLRQAVVAAIAAIAIRITEEHLFIFSTPPIWGGSVCLPDPNQRTPEIGTGKPFLEF
jgi:hypothetical protein